MVSTIQIIGSCRVFSSKCINLKVSTRNIYHEAKVIIIINRYFWQWVQTCLTQGLMFWLSLSIRASPSEISRAWPTCRSEKPSIFAFRSRSLGTVVLRAENGLRNSSRRYVLTLKISRILTIYFSVLLGYIAFSKLVFIFIYLTFW